MSGGTRQLLLGFEGDKGQAARRLETRTEMRERTVRRVEFTPFPRVGSDTRTQVGFTRNVSASGMALAADALLPVGSLLRVIVQKVDGRPDFDAVVRVAWCRKEAGGPGEGAVAWLGVTQVAEVRRGMARLPGTDVGKVRAAS